MRAGRVVGAMAAAVALAALAPSAQGRTIGSATPPAGATAQLCPGDPTRVIWQETGASPSWTVPSGGSLVSWSTNVTGVAGGATISLAVLRQAGPSLTVAAVETATVPAVPPADGVAVFTPATPIALQPGDRLALAGGPGGARCFFTGGAVGGDQTLLGGLAAPGLAPGATLSPDSTSPPGYQLNLAAEVVESLDLRVAASAGPANAVAGGLALVSGTVTNVGQASTPVTFTATIPAGLKIESAVAGGGSCAAAGQELTCNLTELASGAAAPVVVLVTPAAAGTYTTTLSVAGPGLAEATPADNTATATLTVAAPSAAPAAAPCVVPALKRVPLRVARRLLGQLRCKAGKVTKARSKRVPKGAIIRTKPGRGEHAAGQTVRLVVSAGKPRKQRRRD